MDQGDLVPRAETHRAKGRVALGKEREVGDVAVAEPAPAELRIDFRMKVLPAVDALYPSCSQCRERPPDIGQNRACRPQSPIGLLRRGDAVVDAFDPREFGLRGVEKRRRQARHRAGPGDDRQARCSGARVKHADIRNESPRIGEVAIMRAASDGSLGHAVILLLERPDRVYHEIGLARGDRASGVGDSDLRCLGRSDCGEPVGEIERLGLAAPRDDQLNPRVRRQRPANVAAEVAVTAQDDYPQHHPGFATMSQKTITSPTKAGQPSANHQRK